jgi:hypothetical protein
MIKFTLTENSVTLIEGKNVYTANKRNSKWQEIVNAIFSKDYEKAMGLISTKKLVSKISNNTIEIRNNVIFYIKYLIKYIYLLLLLLIN